MDRANARLLPQGGNETEGSITMLDAFADGINTWVISLQSVIDENAALAAHAGSCRKLCVGPHARGHDDEIGGDLGPIIEAQATSPRFGQHGGRLCGHADLEAALLQ